MTAAVWVVLAVLALAAGVSVWIGTWGADCDDCDERKDET